MEVVYYKAPGGNFGDDLNEVLWRHVLPPECFDVPDTLLLGVGTIFDEGRLPESRVSGKRVFVLGSGAGYGPLPRTWPNPAWHVAAVRGPFTAELIGQKSAAATDGAIFLAHARDLLPERRAATGAIYIPHHGSLDRADWKSIAEYAGLAFVDPQWPLERVLHAIASARLVVTEAMHGAILADTLRVPWIPVTTSAHILPFKWLDWCASMNLVYRPHTIAPGPMQNLLQHLKQGHSADTNLAIPEACDRWRTAIGARSQKAEGKDRVPAFSARRMLNRTARQLDSFLPQFAASRLRKAAQSEPTLSGDTVFNQRLAQMVAAARDTATRILRAS